MQSFRYIYEFMHNFSKRHFLEIVAISKTFGKPINKKAVLFEFETFFLFQTGFMMTAHDFYSKPETIRALFCYLIETVGVKYREALFPGCEITEVIFSRNDQYLALLSESDKVLPESIIKRFALNVNGAASNGKIMTSYPVVIEGNIGNTSGLLTSIFLENPKPDYLLFQSCLKSLFQSPNEISELTKSDINNLLAGGYDIFNSLIENNSINSPTPSCANIQKSSTGNYFSAALVLAFFVYLAF